VRQQLREFCDKIEAKRGVQRQALAVAPCFRPLLRWLSDWHQMSLAPRCHHRGPSAGLSRWCDARGLDDRGGHCGPPSPSPGRSSCWPIVACMPAGCVAVSSGWGGIRGGASTAGGPFARTRRPLTARGSASCPSRGHAGGPPAPPSKVPSGASTAHGWPAGKRGTKTPG
jgi:hypothetical protein